METGPKPSFTTYKLHKNVLKISQFDPGKTKPWRVIVCSEIDETRDGYEARPMCENLDFLGNNIYYLQNEDRLFQKDQIILAKGQAFMGVENYFEVPRLPWGQKRSGSGV